MKRAGWFGIVLLVGLITTAAPSEARAGVLVGVDGIWVPAATLEAGGSALSSSHQLDSFGLGAHGTMGLGPVDLGLKVNYFNTSVSIAGQDNRQNELNINALGRFGIPGIGLAILGEAGLATTTGFDGLGYDLGVGGEYGLFSLGPVGVNLGLMGQWVTLPARTNNVETDLKSFRLLASLGFDVGF